MNRIGIDLGGTKIEGVLLDSQNQVVMRQRIPTNQHDGYGAIIKRIVKLINKIEGHSNTLTEIIGICTPGALTPEAGRIKNSNTTCLIGQPLKTDLEAASGRSILMENDANCFAFAEQQLGAGRGFNTVFGVIMGTGVGGGLVINERIFQGATMIAGEWGHHRIDPVGPECYCGQRGCVETYISGPALEKSWRVRGLPDLNLADMVAYLAAHPNDAIAGDWKNQFLEYFGRALANVVNILDPEVIILGGGVSNIDFLYDEGFNYLRKYIFSDVVHTKLLSNQLGDSAGVIGAALLTD